MVHTLKLHMYIHANGNNLLLKKLIFTLSHVVVVEIFS
jgi:hypothetical protein